MTSETAARPVCVYAKANLKRNSTKLFIAMCIGIALALYGCYVSSRMRSNARYTPTLHAATSWFNERLAHSLGHPMGFLTGGARGACQQAGQRMGAAAAAAAAAAANNNMKMSHSRWVMEKLIKPFVGASGLINGMLNVAQIILLKVCCMSVTACDLIIAKSVVGLVVSMMCMAGALMSCKTMCLTCLGIHHAFIIYYALKRRCIIQSMLCPTGATGGAGAPSGGSCASSVVGAVVSSLKNRGANSGGKRA